MRLGEPQEIPPKDDCLSIAALSIERALPDVSIPMIEKGEIGAGMRMAGIILQHPLSGSYALHTEIHNAVTPLVVATNHRDDSPYPYGSYEVYVADDAFDAYQAVSSCNMWRVTPLLFFLGSIHYGGVRMFAPDSELMPLERTLVNASMASFPPGFGMTALDRAFMSSSLIRYGRIKDYRRTHQIAEDTMVISHYNQLHEAGIRPFNSENIYGMAVRVVAELTKA